jgi:hypothetical protein
LWPGSFDARARPEKDRSGKREKTVLTWTLGCENCSGHLGWRAWPADQRRPFILLFLLNGRYVIAYTAILSVDNHISLVFSGQSFCFSDGCFLRSMFGGDPFIPLTPYGPYPFIGDYVLVPGPSLFAMARAFEKELHQFAQ